MFCDDFPSLSSSRLKPEVVGRLGDGGEEGASASGAGAGRPPGRRDPRLVQPLLHHLSGQRKLLPARRLDQNMATMTEHLFKGRRRSSG